MDDTSAPALDPSVDWSKFTAAPAAPAPAPALDPSVDWSQFKPAVASGGDASMAGDAGVPDFGQDEPAHAANEAKAAQQDSGLSRLPVTAAAKLGAGAAGTEKLLGLASGVLPMGYDAITGAFRNKGNDHAAQDWWFGQTAGQSDQQIDQLNDIAATGINGNQQDGKLNKLVGAGAEGLGTLSTGMLTGNAVAGPEATIVGGGEKLFADLSTKELVQQVGGNALKQSAQYSAVPAAESGVATGEKVYDETGSAKDAIVAGATTAGTQVATNLLPAGTEGGVAARLAAGAVSGGLAGEANREATNAALPENMQQSFDWTQTGFGMLQGSIMGLAFHGAHVEDPQIAVVKYNEINKAAESGDPTAQRQATIINDLTSVDGLNADAINASEQGVAAHKAVTELPHEELLTNSPRYRQIYQSAVGTPGIDPAEYAKTTFANEEATNTSWDAYLTTQNKNTAANTTGQVYAQIKDLMAQADQVVPPVEMQKLNRWAFMESRTPLEVRKALYDTLNEKEAPDYIAEKYGDDFHDDGALTQTAFDRDVADHPAKQTMSFDDTPEVASAFAKVRVDPYRLDNGRLAVMGDPDSLVAVAASVHRDSGAIPRYGVEGETTQAEVHPAGREQATGTDAGTEGRNATRAGSDAEAGQPAEADRLDQVEGDQAAEDVKPTPRGEHVAAALTDVGEGVRSTPRGEVQIDEGASPEAAAKALEVAGSDTAADTTDFSEPTEAQARAGNYRKGGVLFKSSAGDIRVKVENPEGSIRRGNGWSRPIKDAHYGYIPGTKGADGEPLDVFMTRRAHDPSLPIAVITQHDPVTGKYDELKVVMGAKNRAEAMALYAKQFPLGLHGKLLPGGKKNVVMMDRAKFHRFLKTGDVDVPPHPISGAPMLSFREAGRPSKSELPKGPSGKSIEDRINEAKGYDIRDKAMVQAITHRRLADGSRFVRTDIADRIVPISKLYKGYEPKSLDRAGELMNESSKGETPRRYPIAVRDNEDGSYTVLKGVDTTTIAEQRGAKAMPVMIVDKASTSNLKPAGILKGEASAELTKTYEQAIANKPMFDSMMKDIAEDIGGHYKAAAIKSRLRSEEKLSLYGDSPSTMKDLVRGSMVFDTLEEARDAMARVATKFAPDKIIKNEDRLDPFFDASTFHGYRDGNMVVELPNGGKAEIQFHIKAIMAAKSEGGGHDLYKILRDPNTSPEDYAKASEASNKLYAEALANSRSADLTAEGPRTSTIDQNSASDKSLGGPPPAPSEANLRSSSEGGISLPEAATKVPLPGKKTAGTSPSPQETNRTPGGRSGKVDTETSKGDSHPTVDSDNVPQRDAVAHRAVIEKHVAKVLEKWKTAPNVHVVDSRSELDPATRKYLDSFMPEGTEPAGIYRNGRVTLFAPSLTDAAHAERVVLHETVGHLGLRGAMGKDLNALLDDIHGSLKSNPDFLKLKDQYRAAYAGRGFQALDRGSTEEYLAKIAESGKDPSTWAKFVAAFRQWARSKGLISRWSEGDLRVLMAGIAKDAQEGRITFAGREPPQAQFDEEAGTVTSTYTGAAGTGSVEHSYDGSFRTLRVGPLEAGLRPSVLNGIPALSVDGLTIGAPADLLRLTRFAAEEGRGVVAIGKDELPRATMEASGIPFTERPGYWELPASSGIDSNPMYSLRNQAKGDDDIEAILAKAVAHPDANLTPWDRMQKVARDIRDNVQSGDSAMALKQSYVDALAPIERYERNANGGLLLDAAQSAYKSAWMAKNNEQITAGILKLGVPAYKNGSFEPVAGRKGLLESFSPLFKTHDGKALDRLWEGYAIAKRSNELIDQTNDDGTSKEKLLTREEIDKLLALEKKYPVFKQVFDDYQKFNHQLLDLAVDRGTMTAETADLWKQHMYVPFFRMQEDSSESNEWRQGRGISGKKVTSKRLYGSDKAIEPVIENIIKNTGAILDKVYANEAMRRVVALTDGLGMERLKIPMKGVEISLGEMEKALGRIGYQIGQSKGAGYTGSKYGHSVPQADMEKLVAFFKQSKPVGNDIVSVYENGKPMYYKVTDQHLYRAVTAFNDLGQFDKVLMNILGVPKKILTLGVTLDPRFMYRNLFRDAVTAWAQTGTNPNMLKGMIGNAKEVWSDKAFLNGLRVAGYNGNEYFKVNEMREVLREMHGSKWTLLNTAKNLYHGYHKIGFVSEQMNRMNIAKHVLGNGGSMAEAAWQAQNTLNFQKRGDSRAFQLLIRAVPFLNARVQGLSRLYDGAMGRDVTMNRKRAVVSFLLKSLGVGLAGMALSFYNKDDPRYQRIPEAAKDLYYHFFVGDHHFILPKPFELGSIMNTIPERIMRKAEHKDNERTMIESFGRVASSIFSFDPTPQVVKPLLEDWANKDGLTGSPIVNQSLSNLSAPAQYDPHTSPTIKGIADAMPKFAPDILRSPKRLEHLYHGYTAQLGMYFMQMADATQRAMGNAPAAPSSRYGSRIVGAIEGSVGMGNDQTDPRNKYVQQLYDAQDQADKAAATVQQYLKQGHVEEARQEMNDNRTALAYRSELHAVAKQMATLRQMEMQVYAAPSMTGDEKRAKLDQITKVRRNTLDHVAPILEIAADYP